VDLHKEDTVYLTHIIQCIQKIEEYTGNVSYDEFYKTSLIQDGVIRQIEIIGEATKRLSKAVTDKYTQVDWKDIAGMRDKLIHHYFGVDIEVVWQTLIEDIPYLKQEVTKILNSK
jgi:uncharacterized protein with HEPN domain